MRVLLVADVVGGVRTFVRELAWALEGQDIELHLALIGPDGPDLHALPAASMEVRNLRLEWMQEPWADVAATEEWIEGCVDSLAPDVVHANTFAAVAGSAPVVLSAHSCVLSWWRAVHGVDAPPAWDRYRSLVEAALARAALLIAPSAALLREFADIYAALPGRTQVIPNGRQVKWPLPSDPGARTRPARERLVVCAGRLWDEGKNVASLRRAAGQINGRVALIGAGADTAEGGELLGPLTPTEVLNWFRRASVFAEPARYEPFGLAAVEAALCGCALVLGDIPSLREVWGRAATFVDPGDEEALTAAVNGLLDDSERRRRAAAAASRRAARYTRAAMGEAYLRAYRTVLREVVAA